MMEATTLCLNNDVLMPRVGLGTYRASESDVIKAVMWADKAGLKLIDTASIYKVGGRYLERRPCAGSTLFAGPYGRLSFD